MKIPENTKLSPIKTDNYDKIDKRLSWLWYSSKDVYEFLTPEKIKNNLDLYINELNTEDFGFQKYKIQRGDNMEYFIITENQKFNLKIIEKIGKQIFSNFVFKPRIYKKSKVVQFNFQQNFLKELAHNIKSNSEKICNIYFDKRGNMDIYMVRFDRYSDSDIFYDLNGRTYIPNEMSKKIGLIRSGDFGSVNEGFIASDEGLKLVINELQKHGYEVGFTNILER